MFLNTGRIKVEQRLLVELPEVSEDTTLQYLIPTTTGPGICSFALVDYLVVQHNCFMEMCQGVIYEEDKRYLVTVNVNVWLFINVVIIHIIIKTFLNCLLCSESIRIWKDHRIRLSLIHCCHLFDYEQQIMSIILSHCHYSLHVGQGQDVTYDFAALEKHIIDRIIQGKPKIIPDMINVSYTKDTFTATNFFAIRSKVQAQVIIMLPRHSLYHCLYYTSVKIMQVELPVKLQREILSELLEIDQTAEALDIINIVLRFLSSGGGRATMNLGDYLLQLRMDRKPVSKMVSLSRIIDLSTVN